VRQYDAFVVAAAAAAVEAEWKELKLYHQLTLGDQSMALDFFQKEASMLEQTFAARRLRLMAEGRFQSVGQILKDRHPFFDSSQSKDGVELESDGCQILHPLREGWRQSCCPNTE
jgi:hypothetical protein